MSPSRIIFDSVSGKRLLPTNSSSMKYFIFSLLFLPILTYGQHDFTCSKSQRRNHNYRTRLSSQDAFDMKYLFLDLEASNLNTEVKGSATLLVEIVSDETTSIDLELIDELVVSQVLLNGKSTSFNHQNNLLTISTSTLISGNLIKLQVFYEGAKPPSEGIFSGINSAVSGSWGNQITWTLSEPFNAHTWWPTKQDLNDKIDSVQVHITTASNLKAGSNGKLMNITPLGNDKVRHEWKSNYPIAYYLVAFAVGEYVEHTNYAKPEYLSGDSILIQNYIYNNPETLPYIQEQLDMIPEMLELFSDLYGPYPFGQEKYGHMMAPFSGGMEHQTMSTMGLFTFGLDAHELAHQWFGNQVTCATWRDIWINEGFARFSEYVATEKLLSSKNAQSVIASDMNSVLKLSSGSVFIPENEELTDSRIFEYNLTYQKGGLIINMIRNIINDDDLFFMVLRTFQTRFQHQSATGEDFRKVLEELTSMDFHNFFQEWYYGSGFPVFDITWAKVKGDSVKINISQSTTDPKVPLFTTPLEFRINYESGVIKRFILQQSSNQQSFTVAANGNVKDLVFDNKNWLIKEVARFNELDENGNRIILTHTPQQVLSIYPNPSTGSFQLNEDTETLSIIDSSGKVVFTSSDVMANTPININHLPAGLYYVHVDERPIFQKLIKK